MIGDRTAVTAIALQFAEALAQRDYTTAYALTSPQYQQQITVGEIQEIYEGIIPADWGDKSPP